MQLDQDCKQKGIKVISSYNFVKKTILIILALLLIFFAGAQFFQPDKNEGERNIETGLFQTAVVNDQIKALLTTSCYDCHSNSTNHPWYSKVFPVSWYLYDHVKIGKEALNFSEWGTYTDNEKISQLVDIGETVSDGEMPLRSFLIIHKEAKLSNDEIQKIVNWTEQEGMRIMEVPTQ